MFYANRRITSESNIMSKSLILLSTFNTRFLDPSTDCRSYLEELSTSLAFKDTILA